MLFFIITLSLFPAKEDRSRDKQSLQSHWAPCTVVSITKYCPFVCLSDHFPFLVFFLSVILVFYYRAGGHTEDRGQTLSRRDGRWTDGTFDFDFACVCDSSLIFTKCFANQTLISDATNQISHRLNSVDSGLHHTVFCRFPLRSCCLHSSLLYLVLNFVS